MNMGMERWRDEEVHSRLEMRRAEEQEQGLQDCAFYLGLGMSTTYCPCGSGAINGDSETINHAFFLSLSFFSSGRRYHLGKPRKAQVALSR